MKAGKKMELYTRTEQKEILNNLQMEFNKLPSPTPRDMATLGKDLSKCKMAIKYNGLIPKDKSIAWDFITTNGKKYGVLHKSSPCSDNNQYSISEDLLNVDYVILTDVDLNDRVISEVKTISTPELQEEVDWDSYAQRYNIKKKYARKHLRQLKYGGNKLEEIW